MSGTVQRDSDPRVGSGVKLTYDDYLLIPDDGMRHELIDGEHYVTAAPNRKHQAIVGNLHWHLRSYLEGNHAGRVYLAPFDVVLSVHDVVEPDLLYVSNARAPRVLDSHVQGAPDLVVEVVSPNTRRRDEVAKKRRYERTGVMEYWIVDPEIHVVDVFHLNGERYDIEVALRLAAGDVLMSKLLPGFAVPLAAVFRD